MPDDNIIMADGERWVFDDEVTRVFDEMLERSIPQYGVMRDLVERVGSHYVTPGSRIVDIGCSRGQAVRPFVLANGSACDYLLLDISEPMVEACREAYRVMPSVEVVRHDIRDGIPCESADLVLGVLTVQFTPIEHRSAIIREVYDTLNEGGAFILVEKVLGGACDIDDMLVDEYYRMKRDNQYTQEQIDSKRKSLEGVLVPVMAKWNEDLLFAAGFEKVECFWRYLNFAGWVAVK